MLEFVNCKKRRRKTFLKVCLNIVKKSNFDKDDLYFTLIPHKSNSKYLVRNPVQAVFWSYSTKEWKKKKTKWECFGMGRTVRPKAYMNSFLIA